MTMRVIGTAGHVDHGKSTLVQRLTGIDPDRLAEEKKRELTIDLGFAWMPLPDGSTVGIIDVPGHWDFIENMLAGVGGIDAVVLVIAADEGVMPQTLEHLAIINLLGVQNGVVALTKTDLIQDREWLDLVELDVAEKLQGTALEGVEILNVSARTGAGIDALVEHLTHLLANLPPRTTRRHPRLPIDRVFTIGGFGTVVTGTLLGGSLSVGDEVEVQPGDLHGRIRSLQSYKQTVEIAQPGSRVAVNVTGIDKDELSRGQVLTHPGDLTPTLLLDAHLHYLPDAGRTLKHNAQVKFFSGAAETTARVRLLNDEHIAPGGDGWLQLRLDTPLAVAQGDRYILRYPSPPQTIGGGVIVNPHPGRRYKRFQPIIIEQLETRLSGTPAERLTQLANGNQPIKLTNLQRVSGYDDVELHAALDEALTDGLLVELPDVGFMASGAYDAVVEQTHKALVDYHRAYPLRLGMPREELRSRLGWKNTDLDALLNLNNAIIREGGLLRLHDHEVRFTDAQEKRIDQLFAEMSKAPFTPPGYAEAVEVVGQDVLTALVDLGHVVQVGDGIIFTRDAYEEMISGTLNLIDTEGEVTAAALRDRFGTSRKFAIALLEHLDSTGVTKRVGDARVRR